MLHCPLLILNFPLWVVTVAAADAPAHNVFIEVQPHRPVVLVGEPVLVTAQVVNGGTGTATLIHHNAPTLDQHTLSVVDLQLGVDEEHFKGWSDRLRIVHRTSPRSLAAGTSITVDLVLLFNAESGLFADEPGRYWIRGRIWVHDIGEILSVPVAIDVRDPTGADRSHWQWLSDHVQEYGRVVQVPWEAKPSEEFLDGANRICESTSIYAEYLALFLSRSFHEGPNKDAARSVSYAEIAKAKASSERVRELASRISSAIANRRPAVPPTPP